MHAFLFIHKNPLFIILYVEGMVTLFIIMVLLGWMDLNLLSEEGVVVGAPAARDYLLRREVYVENVNGMNILPISRKSKSL